MAFKPARGFTLVELLVAISIFGVVSMVAYSGLNSTLSAKAGIEQSADQLAQLQKVFHLMRQDFEQVNRRTVRDMLGDPSRSNAFITVENGVLFTRGGRENPLGLPRPSIERIGWGIKDDKLTRVRWSALDPGNEERIEETPYLEDVETLSMRFLGDDEEWIEQWPPLGSTGEFVMLPRAVEVNVTIAGIGEITRIFLLPF